MGALDGRRMRVVCHAPTARKGGTKAVANLHVGQSRRDGANVQEGRGSKPLCVTQYCGYLRCESATESNFFAVPVTQSKVPRPPCGERTHGPCRCPHRRACADPGLRAHCGQRTRPPGERQEQLQQPLGCWRSASAPQSCRSRTRTRRRTTLLQRQA